jgi:hypothetical protein
MMTYAVSQSDIDAVFAGREYYDGGKVAACFDKVAMATCDTTDADSRFDYACAFGIFRGAQKAGDACAFDNECVSGQCATPGCGNLSCCQGSCIGSTPPVIPPPAQIGQPCALGTGTANSCVDGAFCDFSTNFCVALKTAGMACNQNLECDYGLGCTGSNPTRTCKTLPTLGQPCPDFVCRDEGQQCTSAGATSLCTKVALPGASCATAPCTPYSMCDFNMMKCVPYPAIGQTCTSRCNDVGAFCDSGTSTCTALKPNGAVCTQSNQCATSFCDSAVTGLCADPPTCT